LKNGGKVSMKRLSVDEFKHQYGPWAVVAGGALGLGEAWCNELASRGLNIVSLDRQQEPLDLQAQHLRNKYGVTVRSVNADLTDSDILSQIKEQTNDIEVGLLVFSAAMETDPEIVHSHLFHEGSIEFHHNLIAINIKAVCDFSYYFGALMKARKRGGIIIVSSGADGQGSPFVAHYGASKAYQTVLAEGLWFEMKPHNVDVIAAPLGLTRTTALENFPDAEAFGGGILEADVAVREIIETLGRQPQIVPGRKNRIGQWILKKLVGKEKAIRMMADIHLDNFIPDLPQYESYRKK
jgi:short-subunit dehydrogenase